MIDMRNHFHLPCFKTYIIPGILFGMFLIACSNDPGSNNSDSPNEQNYTATIKKWQEYRIESLKKNWLSLAGLFLLKNGENTFGSHVSNDVVFPKAEAPEHMGSFYVEDGRVRILIEPGVDVYYNDEIVRDMELAKDVDGDPTVISWGSLTWHVIQRIDRIYIRLRDSENPLISEFKGIEYYPLDSGWKFEAQFEPHMSPKVIKTTTTSGDPSQIVSNGAIGFKMGNKYLRLDVWSLDGSERLQTIFADETSGLETYGAGRFIVIEKSVPSGRYIVDFNKAYNPPCAFTQFATCPLPPPQNRLPVSIKAGEKIYRGSTH